MQIVETNLLTRVYGDGETAVTAIKDVNLSVGTGEFVAVMGPSGCGKSTLLHLIGGLDQPTSGTVILEGQDLRELAEPHLTEFRRQRIGFVFQFYNLIPVLTALENTALPLILGGTKPDKALVTAEGWLNRVGLSDRMAHRPNQLSGGQQQRVALARALVAEPALILADEPTGNLDSGATDGVAMLLRKISNQWDRAVLLVTHDPGIAAYADRIVFLKDGTVVDETLLAERMVSQAGLEIG